MIDLVWFCLDDEIEQDLYDTFGQPRTILYILLWEDWQNRI